MESDALADCNRTIVRARDLRRSMSLPKGLLWQVLRKRLSGFKFSRQHPIGPYVLDLYCAAAKVVIEVDGESRRMGRRPQHDQTLNGWLTEQGLRVLRFNASDVLSDLDTGVTAIVRACRE